MVPAVSTDSELKKNITAARNEHNKNLIYYVTDGF
jgi:hypothetical protein